MVILTIISLILLSLMLLIWSIDKSKAICQFLRELNTKLSQRKSKMGVKEFIELVIIIGIILLTLPAFLWIMSLQYSLGGLIIASVGIFIIFPNIAAHFINKFHLSKFNYTPVMIPIKPTLFLLLTVSYISMFIHTQRNDIMMSVLLIYFAIDKAWDKLSKWINSLNVAISTTNQTIEIPSNNATGVNNKLESDQTRSGNFLLTVVIVGIILSTWKKTKN